MIRVGAHSHWAAASLVASWLAAISWATPAYAQIAAPTPNPVSLANASPTLSAAPASSVGAVPASAAPAPAPNIVPAPAEGGSGCVDDWPTDHKRPKMVERFPKRGISGHVARLELELEHLPGEVVFPAGLEAMQLMGEQLSEERQRLTGAHFKLPDAKSDTKPSLSRSSSDAQGLVKTELIFPFIPLPKEAGRFELTLPRLPIAVSRASGQVHTLCTQPHVITVEDPLASEASPAKKPDPSPRSQLEIWTKLRDIVLAGLWLVPLVLGLAWLLYRFRDSWRKKPAPPPPIPPWERARGQLSHLESKDLLRAGEFEKYLDGVTDTLREYLGGRYGFDGLECTTRELLRQLGSRAADFSEEQSVRTILQRADLVKFARRIPSEEECRDAIYATRKIIDISVPAPSLDPRVKVQTSGLDASSGKNLTPGSNSTPRSNSTPGSNSTPRSNKERL